MCRLAGRLLCALALTTAAAAHGDGGSGDWPLHGNDAGGQRHARLDQINRDNVAQLEPAWTWRSGVKATFQATPIVTKVEVAFAECLDSGGASSHSEFCACALFSVSGCCPSFRT